MATIREREKKDGTKSYQAIVRITGQPEARRTFSDRKTAVAWAEAASVAARQSAEPVADARKFKKMKFLAALEAWESSITYPPSNSKCMPSVKRMVGDIALGSFKRAHVLAYIEKARKTNTQYHRPYSDNSIDKHLSILRGGMKHAAMLHDVKVDLDDLFTIAGIEGDWEVERERVMTADEETQIRLQFKARRQVRAWELLFDLALETAARQQEMVLAELKEVNFLTRVWTIPKHHTKKRYARDIPLSERAFAVISELRDLLAAHNLATGSTETRLFHVFATPASVSAGFAQIVDKAGIVDLRFHDLRHTAITRMCLYKRDLAVHEIMRIAGHKSMKMFLRYSNYRAEDIVHRMK